MAKHVKVRLYPDGRIEAKTSQITDKSCMRMMKPIENMLNATVVESAFTPEYYAHNRQAIDDTLVESSFVPKYHGSDLQTDELEELNLAGRSDWQKLLEVTDLLIDGPYKRELPDYSRPWIGSSNQHYHFLTERYRHIEHQLHTIPNRLEVAISPDGIVQINGMGTPEQINALRDCVAKLSVG